MARKDEDPVLARFRQKPRLIRFLHARRRLLASILAGLVAMLLLPTSLRFATRLLIAWDITVALYVMIAFWTFWRTDRAHIRRNAIIEDDGRVVILIVIAIAAFASLGAIISELGTATRTALQLLFVTSTILLSWIMIHTGFALHYAHDYYRPEKPGGLTFPGDDAPDYLDFVYVAFVIGMTAQVSDVDVTNKTIRRTVVAHGLVSFIFNTALLALMVNIAASAL